MFLDYSELLNALDSGASAKITIHNRRIDKAQFEKSLLLPMREDGLDHFRREYNEMLLSKVTGTNNSVVQDRYITITVPGRSTTTAAPTSALRAAPPSLRLRMAPSPSPTG